MKAQVRKLDAVEIVANGIARAYFVTAWASYEEDKGRSFAGQEISTQAPPTPEAVRLLAYRIIGAIENENGTPIWAILKVVALPVLSVTGAEHRDHYADFGWYLGMESMGQGVAWSDSHEHHGYEIPYRENTVDVGETEPEESSHSIVALVGNWGNPRSNASGVSSRAVHIPLSKQQSDLLQMGMHDRISSIHLEETDAEE